MRVLKATHHILKIILVSMPFSVLHDPSHAVGFGVYHLNEEWHVISFVALYAKTGTVSMSDG